MSFVYCNICNIWFLDATFPDRWIGRDGPAPWPPRSPDITPLTSFYVGMLRTKCFRHQFKILQIWMQEKDAFATITEDMLENTWREIDYRLDVLRATKGAHVEVYWCVVKKKLLELHFEKKKYMFVFHVQ